MKCRNTVYAVIAALSFVATAPTLATNREQISIAVPSHDLDLSSQNGMSRMRLRTFVAINDACTPEVWGIRGNIPDARCRAEMRQDAVAKLAERQRGAPSVQVEPEKSPGF